MALQTIAIAEKVNIVFFMVLFFNRIKMQDILYFDTMQF